MKYLTRTVWLLSLLSLFTDISSEMLYPVMPLFLQSIGFSTIMIGLLEGMAEATAGISKGYFGAMSDTIGKRLPFVQLGYLLSGISKPLMALFSFPLWIFGVRTIDRLGKGIRTAARDALLSDECTKENKGKVFGFHRGMDTLGAAIGPVVALVLLYFFPHRYSFIFLLAFIPAMLGLALTSLMKENKGTPYLDRKYSFFSTFSYLPHSPLNYRKLLIGLMVFALFNSSDMFLLLKMKEQGLDEKYVIGVYIFYNLIYAFAAFPVGIIADSVGLKKMFVFGLVLFAAAYCLIATSSTIVFYFIAFMLYGMYAAATEGISKALITTIAPKSETGAAIGAYSGLTSLMALASSVTTGFIWHYISGEMALLVSAGGAVAAGIYIASLKVTESS